LQLDRTAILTGITYQMSASERVKGLIEEKLDIDERHTLIEKKLERKSNLIIDYI